MGHEIERKFLVRGNAWKREADTGRFMTQAYVFSNGDRSARVRITDKSAKLTIKFGSGSMSRTEFEYQIPYDDAVEMTAKAQGRVIEKTRYEVVHENFVWEVDVFHGPLEGLVLAEVELRSEDDKPPLPTWVGREVTGDAHYYNTSLARHGLPDLVVCAPAPISIRAPI